MNLILQKTYFLNENIFNFEEGKKINLQIFSFIYLPIVMSGSRDEAAARSFDSISSDDFDNDDFGDEFASLFDTVEDTSDDEYEY